MKEDLISFETAKLAKEKGFNIDTQKGYYKHGDARLLLWVDSENHNNQEDFICPAPTQSQLQKWLRDAHVIHIKVDDFLDYDDCIDWDFEIVFIGTDVDSRGNYTPEIPYETDRGFKTYEQALEKALYEALKLIKS